MVIPITSAAKACFNMFNKQAGGYLYHVLPTFGASPLFVKNILRRSMQMNLTTEAPLCTYDPKTQILTAPEKLRKTAFSQMYIPSHSSRMSWPTNRWLMITRRERRRNTPHPK
jgi:hypothetical protein